jgi:hypothetical protein
MKNQDGSLYKIKHQKIGMKRLKSRMNIPPKSLLFLVRPVSKLEQGTEEHRCNAVLAQNPARENSPIPHLLSYLFIVVVFCFILRQESLCSPGYPRTQNPPALLSARITDVHPHMPQYCSILTLKLSHKKNPL